MLLVGLILMLTKKISPVSRGSSHCLICSTGSVAFIMVLIKEEGNTPVPFCLILYSGANLSKLGKTAKSVPEFICKN